MHDPTILIIEDEKPIRSFAKAYLQGLGMKLVEAERGEEGLSMAASHRPEVILLDLGLPDMDGIKVISRLREWTDVPIIILSARDAEAHKVAALDAGADDYLTKPFGVEELAARIRAALRRSQARGSGPAPQVLGSGELRIDLTARQVLLAGQEVHLTPIEYKLLVYLARNAGKVLTHGQILREVWGLGSEERSHYPRIYVHQLRQKIESDPARPRFLRTESGVGYRFAASPVEQS